jgi:hypothetical protein
MLIFLFKIDGTFEDWEKSFVEKTAGQTFKPIFMCSYIKEYFKAHGSLIATSQFDDIKKAFDIETIPPIDTIPPKPYLLTYRLKLRDENKLIEAYKKLPKYNRIILSVIFEHFLKYDYFLLCP